MWFPYPAQELRNGKYGMVRKVLAPESSPDDHLSKRKDEKTKNLTSISECSSLLCWFSVVQAYHFAKAQSALPGRAPIAIGSNSRATLKTRQPLPKNTGQWVTHSQERRDVENNRCEHSQESLLRLL